MTPLASRLAKQLVVPKRKRWLTDEGCTLVRQHLDDTHCFEVTAAVELERELRDTVQKQGAQDGSQFIGQYVFLPAPKTWIEYFHPQLGRHAFSLIETPTDDATAAFATWFIDDAINPLGWISLVSDDYRVAAWPDDPMRRFRLSLPTDRAAETVVCDLIELLARSHGDGSQSSGVGLLAQYLMSCIHMFLIVINTPRIVGRKQHMPNRNLERKLMQKLSAGKFPLHAWTEIKLEIAKPPEIDDGEPHEAHLTGRRALHFCRKHIRIRNGKLEYVRAHWRGDPAIGIKRSRYVLTKGAGA